MSKKADFKKRIAALVCAAVMIFAVLSAVCFIGAEAGHSCTGEDCLICLQTAACDNLLKSGFAAAALIAVMFCVSAAVRSVCRNNNKISADNTLVTLNIKISD